MQANRKSKMLDNRSRSRDNPNASITLINEIAGLVPLVIKMFHKKDGGISVVAKKRSAIGTFL